MGEFTDKDRERAQKTLTLLEQHIVRSADQHNHHSKLIDDHEKRIRTNTTFRNWLVGIMTVGGGGAGITKFWPF